MIFLIAYVKIISRAGYSGWWVLMMFVPIVNIVMLLIFAFKEWPIQRELRRAARLGESDPARRQQGYGSSRPGYGGRP